MSEWKLIRQVAMLSDLVDEVMLREKLGCSKRTLKHYRMYAKYECPPPIAHIDNKRCVWLRSDIEPWVKRMMITESTRRRVKKRKWN